MTRTTFQRLLLFTGQILDVLKPDVLSFSSLCLQHQDTWEAIKC